MYDLEKYTTLELQNELIKRGFAAEILYNIKYLDDILIYGTPTMDEVKRSNMQKLSESEKMNILQNSISSCLYFHLNDSIKNELATKGLI